MRTISLPVKRAIDLVAAGLLLVISAPVMAAIALAIKLDSRGPVLFSQQREGWHGEAFRIHKFRTMVVGAADGAAVSSIDDARVTRVGRWLRVNSLDELPQLVNVLRGDMSLVGPRPLLPGTTAAAETRRWAMRPGLTNLVEVSDAHLLDWDARMQLDILYVDGWSLWLDLKILFKTVPVIFGRKDAVDPPRVSTDVPKGETT
jgi:lipopolysaccharide/colanic/teichoic acid biosynthesis glycosyltransferase